MNFKGKDYIIDMPQCLPGMDKRANNFHKWRTSSLPSHCFHGAWSMAGIFHTRENYWL